jgi:hypothetical protein
LNEHEIIKKGIERRIDEIVTGSEQRFESELKDLICAYRELKPYLMDDSTYLIKRRLMGIFLLSQSIERRGKRNVKRQTRRCFSL